MTAVDSYNLPFEINAIHKVRSFQSPYQRRLLEAFETDVVLEELLGLVVFCKVMVGRHHNWPPVDAVVGAVR